MSVYDEVRAEREYQDKKWGHANDDAMNTPFHWVTWISKYSTGFTDGTWNPSKDAFRKSMIKVAATAIAAVESIDRMKNEKG